MSHRIEEAYEVPAPEDRVHTTNFCLESPQSKELVDAAEALKVICGALKCGRKNFVVKDMPVNNWPGETSYSGQIESGVCKKVIEFWLDDKQG